MPQFLTRLDNPDHTARLGGALAGLLRAGDVVLLTGELGAGKTTLVRAVALALGVDPRLVSSPTYTIVHEYPADGGLIVVHADAYRLEGQDRDELDLLGWDSAHDGPSITLIEWGERVAHLIDTPCAAVSLRHAGEHERDFTLDAPEAFALRVEWPALASFLDTPGRT